MFSNLKKPINLKNKNLSSSENNIHNNKTKKIVKIIFIKLLHIKNLTYVNKNNY
jgi:hypothetical protein